MSGQMRRHLLAARWGIIATLGTACAFHALTATPVAAQGKAPKLERGDTVVERRRPDYDPAGIQLGAFRLFPLLEVTGRYNDNLFAENTNEDDDLSAILMPELRLKSEFGIHEIRARLAGEFVRFRDQVSENHENYYGEVQGRYDTQRFGGLSTGLSVSRQHEERDSPDDLNSLEPTRFDNLAFNIGYRHNFNRLTLRFRGIYETYDFDDAPGTSGTVINNDDRDRDVISGSIRAGYIFSPQYEAFVGVGLKRLDYEAAVDDFGHNRDADVREVFGGVAAAFSGVTEGELSAGIEDRDVKDTSLNSRRATSVKGNLTWNITPLTTVTGVARRVFRETSLPTADSVLETRLGFNVDHELLRNLLLNGNFVWIDRDFGANGREDTVLSANVGAKYLINRNLYLGLELARRDQKSNDTTADFVRHTVALRIGIQN